MLNVLLPGYPGIPKVYALGRSNFHEYLAIQLLGKHIEPKESVSTMRDLAALAYQMVSIALRFTYFQLNERVSIFSPLLRCSWT